MFSRYATPFITGLFLVSLISGIALFFHVGPGGFHGMHEWLSMLLILGVRFRSPKVSMLLKIPSRYRPRQARRCGCGLFQWFRDHRACCDASQPPR